MMREKMARALFKMFRGVPPQGQAWRDYLEDANAILHEMREPTPHMVSDGAFQIFQGERITDDDLAAARRVWRAMTKAALSEEAPIETHPVRMVPFHPVYSPTKNDS